MTTISAAAEVPSRAETIARLLDMTGVESRAQFDFDFRSYVSAEVFRPEDQWRAAIEQGQFDVIDMQRIFAEATDAVVQHSEEVGRELSVEEVDRVMHSVIQDSWKCPFPFYFC